MVVPPLGWFTRAPSSILMAQSELELLRLQNKPLLPASWSGENTTQLSSYPPEQEQMWLLWSSGSFMTISTLEAHDLPSH